MEELQICHDYALKYYGKLLLASEKTITDEFLGLAEYCKSNKEQRHYFETLEHLKNRSETMRVIFRQQLNNNYNAFIEGRDEESSIEEEINNTNLSLIDRDELEVNLAISVIISKSNSRNSESLWKLNRRLAVLRGGKNVNDETNPFGPTQVCNALKIAVTELGLDNKAKILTYKHLGKLFVIRFSDILETLNTLLTDKGVLPNLRFSLSNTGANQNALNENIGAIESTESTAHQQELYNTIRALQSQSGPRMHSASGVSFSGLSTGNNNDADIFSPLDFALALSAIQQSRVFLSQAALSQPVATEKNEEKLFAQLSKQADKQGRHKISKDHAGTVDLVGLIFRYMLDDPKIPDTVKSLLSHLHTPYLKLALIDNSFLSDTKHSARLLLNKMADVGSLWVKESNDRTVLPMIKKTVETILKEFIDDNAIFDELLDDFNHFKHNLEKRAKMVEKRNTESQQGLERLEISKQQAHKELNNRLQQKKIPEKICTILEKPWSDFLSFNLLRHGEKSLTWKSALSVMDGVVWSIKPDKDLNHRDDIYRHQQNLTQSIAEGLQTIGYDQQASKELLSSLKEAHKLTLLGSNINKVKTPAVRPPNTKPKTAVKPVEPALSHVEKNMLKTLKTIAFGTWFEFKRETTAVQLKLAWFSQVSSHYMFVDHSGVKQIVESQYNLARGMCSGEISIVKPDQKSFMERALEAVLDTLKLNK